MLNRGRFIQGKAPRSSGKGPKKNDHEGIDTSNIRHHAHGLSARKRGGEGNKGCLTPPAPPSLRESLELINKRSSSSNSASKHMSARAEKHLVDDQYEEGYSLEVPMHGGGGGGDSDFDCSDSVSSLNDSVYFGGGASVTGGYSSRHAESLLHLSTGGGNRKEAQQQQQRSKSLVVGVVPGSSPDAPINLLSSIALPKNDDGDDDDEDDFEPDRDGDIVTLQNGSLPQDYVMGSHGALRLAEEGRIVVDGNVGDDGDQDSAAVFTAAQSAIVIDEMDEFFPANPGSPSAFQKIDSHDGTTALSPASAVSHTSTHSDDESNPKARASRRRSGGCMDFIRSAPYWLKIVFLLSMLALIGAAILLTVGLNVAHDLDKTSSESAAVEQRTNEDQSSSSQTTSAPMATDFVPQVISKPTPTKSPVKPPKAQTVVPVPTGKPVAAAKANKKVATQTAMPTVDAGSNDTTEAPVPIPIVRTAFPVAPPTPSPVATTEQPAVAPPTIAAIASLPPTQAPASTGSTGDIEHEKWTVYLTTGRYSNELRQEITTSLGSIAPDDNSNSSSFFVHLGDWGDAATCDEASYQEVSTLFQASSIPVYFVMGDNEYNDCSDPVAAKALWKTYLLDFETQHWDIPRWDIMRQGDSSIDFAEYSENFLFSHGQAAFLSINLGSGESTNPAESQPRHEANLLWIDAAYNLYRESSTVTTIFILADDGPPGAVVNELFFQDLLGRISIDYADMEFVFIHRGLTDWGQTEEYQGIKNLDVIQVLGPIWPPLRMTVEFKDDKRSIKLDDAW